MSQHFNRVCPLYLSSEEAMDLLDLCLMSSIEIDPDKERAILKLTDLVRRFISNDEDIACAPCEFNKEAVVSVRYDAEISPAFSGNRVHVRPTHDYEAILIGAFVARKSETSFSFIPHYHQSSASSGR